MVKKLLFFCELSGGHLQMSITLARLITKNYKGQYEIWFVTNNEYKEIISKRIDNCNFLVYSRTGKEENSDEFKKSIIDFFGKYGDKWNERDRVSFCKKLFDNMKNDA